MRFQCLENRATKSTRNMLSKSSLQSDNFYSPVSASGYLTPLQRKKLREKRELDISGNNEELVTPKNPKKLKQRDGDPQPKNPSSKPMIKKKHVKSTRSKSRCITSDLLVKGNTGNGKNKKFFKNRSPQRLKKAKFSMPMTYKKKRLVFNSRVHQNSAASVKSVDNSPDRVSENTSEKIASPKVQPTVDTIQNTSTVLMVKDINTLEVPSAESKCTENATDNSDPHTKTDAVICEVKEEVCDKGIFDFDWPSDEELLERRNRAILNNKLNQVNCDQEPNESVDDAENASSPKLFPIFLNCKTPNGKNSAEKRSNLKKSPTFIKDSSNGGEQMIIDAGQKEIGAKVCPTCNMLYTVGAEYDEILHSKYHTTYLINLKFLGWKDEQVVGNYDDGRIILIKNSDKYFKLKKVQDVLFIANRDLGFAYTSFPNKPNTVFLLFISNEKQVCGCVVAEPIEEACQIVMGNEGKTGKAMETVTKSHSWYASTKTFCVSCGINRIWVSNEFRRRKVGSRMLDCLRQNFLFGHVVDLDKIAFTDPTPDGRVFAASYTGTDNFLVYNK